MYWKERNELILFAYDLILLTVENNPKESIKTVGTNKWVQQGCTISGQYRKSCNAIFKKLIKKDKFTYPWKELKYLWVNSTKEV